MAALPGLHTLRLLRPVGGEGRRELDDRALAWSQLQKAVAAWVGQEVALGAAKPAGVAVHVAPAERASVPPGAVFVGPQVVAGVEVPVLPTTAPDHAAQAGAQRRPDHLDRAVTVHLHHQPT